MPKGDLILSIPRICVFCGDRNASHLKVLTVKEEVTKTLVCALCEAHSQLTDTQIIKAAQQNPDRVCETTISGLTKNRIEVHQDEIQIWG